MNKRVTRGLTASAVIAGAVVLGASTIAPARAGSLPGATKTKSFPDGQLTIKLYDESAKISKAVTNIPTSREVMVSGKVRVSTSGGVKGGSINAGYVVGCQLTFGAGAGTEGSQKLEQGAIATGESKGSVKIGPGEAAYVPIVKMKIDDEEVNSFDFTGATGGIAYSGERFNIDGCAGYAQARAQVTVQVKTDTFKGNVTMYGKPFSIG